MIDDLRSRGAAFFDVDGTIVDANIVTYYVYFATRGLTAVERVRWFAAFLPKVLYYGVLDRMSRRRFNQVFYRNYRGMDANKLREMAEQHFGRLVEPRIFPGAKSRIAGHHARSEPVVLVTGSLDFLVAPLAALVGADATFAVGLQEREGRFTGELTTAPLSDEEKARTVRAFAAAHGIDLGQSVAYADSAADLPFLRTVGRPVAVNPDSTLRRMARISGWAIEDWRSSSAETGSAIKNEEQRMPSTPR